MRRHANDAATAAAADHSAAGKLFRGVRNAPDVLAVRGGSAARASRFQGHSECAARDVAGLTRLPVLVSAGNREQWAGADHHGGS